jgi:hypothetical protein
MEYFKRRLRSVPSDQRAKFLAETPCTKGRPLLSVVKEAGTDDAGLERFRLTDSGVDREGDVIVSAGVDTAQWQAYGSLLWGHDPSKPEYVLGAPVDVIKGDTFIDATFRFATEDENPLGAMVHRMIKAGLVRGSSVGLIIREYAEATDRGGFFPLNILSSELIEDSITPIPANPRAVRQEFPSEEDQAEILEIVERTVEEVGVTPNEEALALEFLNELNGQRIYSIAADPVDPVLAAYRALKKGN